MSEEILPGGNTVGAARIGEVVHKQAAASTPSVHALLRHLEAAGITGVPARPGTPARPRSRTGPAGRPR